MTADQMTHYSTTPYGSESIYSPPRHAPFPVVTEEEALASRRFDFDLETLAQAQRPRSLMEQLHFELDRKFLRGLFGLNRELEEW